MPGDIGADIVTACGGLRGVLASPPSGLCFLTFSLRCGMGLSGLSFALPLFFFFKRE